MGKFIVVEGPDGSGKSTLAKRLTDYIRDYIRRPALCASEPSCGAIGALLRDALRGCLVFSTSAMERLFIADREDHCLKLIGPCLEKKDVICDRYYYSTMVYQALERLGSFESGWVLDKCVGFGTSMQLELNDMFREILGNHFYKTIFGRGTVVIHPDLAIVLVADPSVLIYRIESRGSEKDLYESNSRVHIVAEAYRLICKWMDVEIANRYTMYPGECSTLIPEIQTVIDVSCKTEEEVFKEAVLSVDSIFKK